MKTILALYIRVCFFTTFGRVTSINTDFSQVFIGWKRYFRSLNNLNSLYHEKISSFNSVSLAVG